MLMVFDTIILIITDIDNVKGIRVRLLEDIKPVNEILFLSHMCPEKARTMVTMALTPSHFPSIYSDYAMAL